jgi:multiple sugar transport system ATP-binding protein
MAPVSLEKVTKVYPNGFKAVEELSLDVGDGEFMVLVGPSGCGKTTALRMVAGLEDISEGTLRISGRVMNDVSPKDRDIAMVFQNYALYPHMTVAENIGFALSLRKVPKAKIKAKVRETAELLGLTEWIDRKPGQLSGGQRQRVAMGRAIVREPSVFLMDEPLSNLDAKLRVQMRAEVSRIQRRVGVATLYVTHDQVEAMTMGDRVAVLSSGVLQQCDKPQALYDNPKNLFVAGFMGSPAMNLFEATIGEGASSVIVGSQTIELPASLLVAKPALRGYANRPVVVGIRPEDLSIQRSDDVSADPNQASAEQSGATVFEGNVELVEALGSEQLVHFTSDAHHIEVGGTKDEDAEGLSEGLLVSTGEGVARVDARAQLTVGGRVRFHLNPGRIHFFDVTTSEAIAN